MSHLPLLRETPTYWSSHPQVELKYDKDIWREVPVQPLRTLQMFVTNRCNLRCEGCFYAARLDQTEMSLKEYIDTVDRYAGKVDRITILGGEPTLHRDLPEMVRYNRGLGLKTTIYTNGRDLDRTCDLAAQVRVGVHGLGDSEKPLTAVPMTIKPFTLVYMLSKANMDDLRYVPGIVNSWWPQVDQFYLSSIRDVTKSGDFWADTPGTLSNERYAEVVQNFINNPALAQRFRRLHISTRGTLKTAAQDFSSCQTCRFGNLYPGGQTTQCPMDIGLGVQGENLFPEQERRCRRSSACVLQKICLERI